MPTQPSKTGVHNESRAEFNGTGPTVDAAVSVQKPQVGQHEIVVGAIGVAIGVLLRHALPRVLKGVSHTAETAAEIVE